jgi:hypothetical protein
MPAHLSLTGSPPETVILGGYLFRQGTEDQASRSSHDLAYHAILIDLQNSSSFGLYTTMQVYKVQLKMGRRKLKNLHPEVDTHIASCPKLCVSLFGGTLFTSAARLVDRPHAICAGERELEVPAKKRSIRLRTKHLTLLTSSGRKVPKTCTR